VNPRKIWLIAKREYIVNFRRKSFLFTAFGMPLLVVVIMVVVMSMITSSLEDTSGYKSVGVVDHAGVFVSASGAKLAELSKPFALLDTDNQAADMLQKGQIDGYYVLPKDFMTVGSVEAFYRQTLALNEGLRAKFNEAIKQALSTRLDNPAAALRLENPLKELNIYKLGNPQPLDESALIASFMVPVMLGYLIFILTMTTSQFMMSGLSEEKENRMMELFVTSSRPSEMLWGKMLGSGALGLSQIGIWAIFGIGYALLNRTLDIGRLLATMQITPGYLAMVLAYTTLGYLLFGSLMAGIAATTNAEAESRQIASIFSIVGVVPLILLTAFLMDPNGSLPVLLSMIPFTAPVSMILRTSLATVPAGEIVVSLLIMVVSVFGVVWISARIFRLGMLNYGKRPSLRAIWRGVFGGRALVSAAAPREVVS
jgi:ABC-2 type transport system permease protein